MTSPSPDRREADVSEMAPPEPAESERLAKLTGENARLRSEIRQALARAQRAESDATRVRGSTKFQVGDLLVKAARRPSRLFLLPRDLLRLYRLRRHRRTQPAPTDTESLRARRSDYSDEIAARLLLPRVAARQDAPLSVAGALDPLTAAQWRHVAATTSVLPHDGATLIHDVDPDVVVIDTAAAGPSGTWAHLGNPAATDRAIAARELITAAKANGRPVMLLRSTHDNPGFDWIAASCDLVVDLPGSAAHKPWHPGVDLGCAMRIDPRVLTDDHGGASDRGVLIADDVDVTAAGDVPLVRAWESFLRTREIPRIHVASTGPAVTDMERAVRNASIVALAHQGAGQAHSSVVGAPVLALIALISGRRLVAAHDDELRQMLGLDRDADSRRVGWFDFPPHDADAAVRAMSEALTSPAPDLTVRWRIWRSVFVHAASSVAWSHAVGRLGLGARPLSIRDAALVLTSTSPLDVTELDAIGGLLVNPSGTIREVICSSGGQEHLNAVVDVEDARVESVIGVAFTGDPHGDRAIAAQACRSPLLIFVEAETSNHSLSARDVIDAVVAYEIADSGGHVCLVGSGWCIRVLDREAALTGSLPKEVCVDHAPSPHDGDARTRSGDAT